MSNEFLITKNAFSLPRRFLSTDIDMFEKIKLSFFLEGGQFLVKKSNFGDPRVFKKLCVALDLSPYDASFKCPKYDYILSDFLSKMKKLVGTQSMCHHRLNHPFDIEFHVFIFRFDEYSES